MIPNEKSDIAFLGSKWKVMETLKLESKNLKIERARIACEKIRL